jgi:hypothetical protein
VLIKIEDQVDAPTEEIPVVRSKMHDDMTGDETTSPGPGTVRHK